MSQKKKSVFGEKEFTEKEYQGIQKQLSQPLSKEHLSRRPGGGGTFDYVSAWVVIDLANRVFGFNGWSSQIISVNQDHFGQTRDGKFEVAISALVRVTLKDGAYHEGFGFGSSKGMKNKFQCLETGKKKAITDATKRALKLFGNYLGNGLEIREKDFSRYEQKRKSSSVYEAAENEIDFELKKPRNNQQLPSQYLPQNFQIKQDPIHLNDFKIHQQQQQQQSNLTTYLNQNQLQQQKINSQQQNLNNNIINDGTGGQQQNSFPFKKNVLTQNNQGVQEIGNESIPNSFFINQQPQTKIPFQQQQILNISQQPQQIQQQQRQQQPQQQQQQQQQQQNINNQQQNIAFNLPKTQKNTNSFVQYMNKEVNTQFQSTINTQIKSSQPFQFHNKTNSSINFDQQIHNNQILQMPQAFPNKQI
ncbi:DNA repair and recombination protein rad52 rad59 [Anaeramoeba flamelloides]|uniref:DNA repair and recombination protein rad52 rad59 n=1 Tax=Anaeramoeba flamelloides TaxID=1746091 RepID=A0AAV7YRQ6_9EUKA|nr:DNA repair and recombination protein rad52 rad59 [Anaeramoeba flamelloides]